MSATKFFTNRDGNTLIKEFEGILSHNSAITNLDAVVGFLRASGYFTLRPFLDNIDKVRIIGKTFDKTDNAISVLTNKDTGEITSRKA